MELCRELQTDKHTVVLWGQSLSLSSKPSHVPSGCQLLFSHLLCSESPGFQSYQPREEKNKTRTMEMPQRTLTVPRLSCILESCFWLLMVLRKLVLSAAWLCSHWSTEEWIPGSQGRCSLFKKSWTNLWFFPPMFSASAETSLMKQFLWHWRI